MAGHLIALFVTVEQENAIKSLFGERGWPYQPEGKYPFENGVLKQG